MEWLSPRECSNRHKSLLQIYLARDRRKINAGGEGIPEGCQALWQGKKDRHVHQAFVGRISASDLNRYFYNDCVPELLIFCIQSECSHEEE